jgi:hypothetical protein
MRSSSSFSSFWRTQRLHPCNQVPMVKKTVEDTRTGRVLAVRNLFSRLCLSALILTPATTSSFNISSSTHAEIKCIGMTARSFKRILMWWLTSKDVYKNIENIPKLLCTHVRHSFFNDNRLHWPLETRIKWYNMFICEFKYPPFAYGWWSSTMSSFCSHNNFYKPLWVLNFRDQYVPLHTRPVPVYDY